MLIPAPLSPAKAPPAARLCRPVPADPRRSSARGRRLDSRAEYDGFRILAFKDGHTVRLWSRNGRDWSSEFVAIAEAMQALPFERVMLDGEAVAHYLDRGD